MEQTVGLRPKLRPAPGELPFDDLLAGVYPRVELRHEDLGGVAETFSQGVQRADVVAVAVRERDPANRPARARRGGDELVGRASQRRIDERETVVLADEEGVDEMKPRELGEVLRDRRQPHRVLRGHVDARVACVAEEAKEERLDRELEELLQELRI